MNLATNSLSGIAILLVLVSFQGQALAQDAEGEIFPDWIKQSISIWINGQISDSEFLALAENVLERDILFGEAKSKKTLIPAAEILASKVPESYQGGNEMVPFWVKERAQWWIDGKITDAQFLRTIHHLREEGYLEYNPDKNTPSNGAPQSGLERFLLTEKEILNITKETKWRILSTEYGFEEKKGVVDSVRITLTDITRVYEPVFYKFKVPSLAMQILEFDSQADLENYWNSFENRDKQAIFDSAHARGNPSQDSECLFNYAPKGAVTACSHGDVIFQVIIFDQHGEHFDYDQENLVLDETEPTSRFSSEILKKIGHFENDNVTPLHHAFKQVIQDESLEEPTDVFRAVSKSAEPEKSAIRGIENLSCIRDDFGLVTISGQYNNDNVKRAKVELVISFLDSQGNSMGTTSTDFYNLQEFESKRFVGHSKWDANFHNCQAGIG